MTEHQNWIQDKLGFLRSHSRHKGLIKLSGVKSQAGGASASAQDISRTSTETGSMEITMRSTDTTLQPQQITSPTAASGHSLVNQQVMDQLTQMKTMLSSFLGKKQETTTCTAFCNYLESEVEGLEEKDFQTFRNEAVKLLSSIQSRAEEHGHQPQQPQKQPLSRSSSATSTFVPQTFQQRQQLTPTAREYILTIPDTQMPLSQVIQPVQQNQNGNQRTAASIQRAVDFLPSH